jgi:beta-1,4-mannosyltransferase
MRTHTIPDETRKFNAFLGLYRQKPLETWSKQQSGNVRTVLFLPDFRSNPYQRLLATALAKQGVNVVMRAAIGGLPVFGAIRTHGKPDLLHLHWIAPFFVRSKTARSIEKAFRFAGQLVIARLLGIKIVWTIHNLLEHERRHVHLERLFSQFLVRLCNQLIVHCSFARKAIIETYRIPDLCKDKICVIPHGHYIDSYANQISQEQARAKLELGTDEIVFLYFGRIRSYKGVLPLVEVFRKLESPQVRLLIVGRPASEMIGMELMRRCQPDSRICLFPKFIPDEDVQLYMNAASVVVLPYQDILNSGAALLAMSFAKAVIIPRLGCIPEVFGSQGGFLYDPDEEGGLLKAMQQALVADLAAMGQHNYHRAKHFDWNVIARQTYEVYRRCWSSEA